MSVDRLFRSLLVCAAALTAAGSAKASVIALEFDPLSGTVSAGSQYTMGWKFTPNTVIGVACYAIR
jgi:hypothetical protein